MLGEKLSQSSPRRLKSGGSIFIHRKPILYIIYCPGKSFSTGRPKTISIKWRQSNSEAKYSEQTVLKKKSPGAVLKSNHAKREYVGMTSTPLLKTYRDQENENDEGLDDKQEITKNC